LQRLCSKATTVLDASRMLASTYVRIREGFNSPSGHLQFAYDTMHG
jgi:hypothetical protein